MHQIQCVLDSDGIPELVELANSVPRVMASENGSPGNQSRVKSNGEVDPKVRNEACWVLLKAVSCGSDQQIVQLAEDGCAQVLFSLLTDASMEIMALEGSQKVLQAGEEIAIQELAEKVQDHGVHPHI